MKRLHAFIFAILMAGFFSHADELTEPGWYWVGEESLLTPETLDPGGSGGSSSLTGNPEIAEAATPEIQALARGLENDPKRIFDYVHDHIRYVCYFGSKKGAQLTLLERSGNDFDQAALLIALLRSSGFSNVNYQFGTVSMPYQSSSDHVDFQHWVGSTRPNTNWYQARNYAFNLLVKRGFPTNAVAHSGTNDLILPRVWVKLDWGGTNYLLDPAFKVSEPIAGINLAAAMQLDTNTLMVAAGGTGNADYAQNISEANLRNELKGYATNFLNHLQSNYPNASVEEILGGQRIVSSVEQSLGQVLSFKIYTNAGAWPSPREWDNIPSSLMSALTVTLPGTNRTILMPELRGDKLALIFSNGLAGLWLEDTNLWQATTTGGSSVQGIIKVDHPHGLWNFTNYTLIGTNWNDQAVTNAYQRTNASYIICYGFEPGREWLRERQNKLDNYRQKGLSNTSREIVTETLNVMGLNWLVQTHYLHDTLAAQREMLLQYHHRVGRMAQEGGKGYYIDVYGQINGNFAASGNNMDDIARSRRIFELQSYFSSAAEHGLIEQMQATNVSAASTIKMLRIANAIGQKIFLARNNNWTSGTAVRSQLVDYGATTNTLATKIYAGFTILLPQDGNNLAAGAGSWRGYGAVVRGNTGGLYGLSMEISGNYSGGFSGYPGSTINTPWVAQTSFYQPQYFSPSMDFIKAGDPVSMANGAFTLASTDLSLGQAEPRGLSFSRYYSPTRRYHNASGIAHGWVHNYQFDIAKVSAPLAGLGATTPAQMAPLIVATRAAYEVYSTNESPKACVVAALITKWGMDQLTTNGVSISMGNEGLQFIQQPDGSFTPPASCTMTLTTNGTGFNLAERHGRTFKFNSTRLTNIVDQYGKTLSLAYNSSNRVQTVMDWKGRTLTFAYTGSPQRLSSVTDSTGRAVSFGYATNVGQLDLASVTDPENKTSTYLYDTNHQMLSVKDALNRVVTTNIYDDFGRVITQHNQGDTNQAWQFYWSCYVNVEQDPAGSRRRFYYDDKQRNIAVEDALGNTSRTAYDGQNHVVMRISPLNETNRFEYDARHNLTNAVDPLGYSNQFVYDAENRLTQTIDARGNPSLFGYNAKFQLTGTTNGAGDWTTFTYNAGDGTLEAKSDAAGTIAYGYDTYGQLNQITYPNSLGSESFVNNALGDATNHTDARGFVTTLQYNQRRQLTNTIAPTNITTSISYDDVGNVLTKKDARGFVSSHTWSATRKLMATTFPATPQGTPVVTNVYDNRDWVKQELNPLQQATLYTNDAAGRLVTVIDPLLRPTRFLFDANGRQIAATNAATEVVRQQWNARGELIRLTNAALNAVGYEHDAAGNQITLTNRNGKKWQFQFDGANRLTNTITPLGRSTAQTYNHRGLLSSMMKPSGETATLLYDAKGRLTNKVDGVGSILYQYDPNDNLTNVLTLSPQLSSNNWTFDAYDRVASYRDADGNFFQYLHDANGNLTNLVYPGGKTVRYAYDSLNRLTNVTDWADRQTSIEYDLASQVKKITRPNGTVREMSYDAAGQTTNIIEKMGIGVPIAVFKLNWNNAGRMEWEFTAPLPHAYTPPTRTMTFDDDNRLATFNGNSVGYDLDGNMTNGPGTNATFIAYSYDARNRLVGTTSTASLTYGYDALGNRTSITNGTEFARFAINPNAALSQALIRVKNGVTNYYVYGLGLLYEADDSGDTRTYHFDSRGSTAALTDGNGIVTDRMEYSAYGTTTYRSGTTDTPFLYNGRYGVMTDANGLLHMRARYYNPYLGRFLNPDPAGFSGGMNFYAYADGNPVSMFDPFGLGAVGESGGGSWLRTTASVSVGMMPVAGTVQSGVELISGMDYITGEPTSRVLAGVGVVAGLAPGGKAAVKAGAKLLGKVFGRTDEVVDVLGKTGNETVTLYHHTTGQAGKGVNQTGILKGSKTPGLWRPWKTDDVYLSTKPELSAFDRLVYGLPKSKTEAVVPVTLPQSQVVNRPFGIRIVEGPIQLGPPQKLP